MPDDDARNELIGAVRAILRPLVRQLVAHGLTFPAFSRIGKEVYIEVGTKHFALPFKKQTDSRVALVTGITRKEIGQIRRGQVPAHSPHHLDYAIATRVISRWVSEAEYLDARGNPSPLPYETEENGPSFVRLVNEVGGDIPPRAIADELTRVGAAEMTPRGAVRLLQKAYIPARSAAEKISILGADASELIGAIAHNIEASDEAPFLQRKVYYDNVGGEALPDLRQKVRDAGAEFLQAMNSLFAAVDRDRNPNAPGGTRKRVVLGLYYFDEDHASADAAEPAESPPHPRKRK